MADFVQSSQSKNAVRELATPIASVSAFNLIVQSVITDNPFECVAYMTAGETHDPVEKTREGYTAKMVYEDGIADLCIEPRWDDYIRYTGGADGACAGAARPPVP